MCLHVACKFDTLIFKEIKLPYPVQNSCFLSSIHIAKVVYVTWVLPCAVTNTSIIMGQSLAFAVC